MKKKSKLELRCAEVITELSLWHVCEPLRRFDRDYDATFDQHVETTATNVNAPELFLDDSRTPGRLNLRGTIRHIRKIRMRSSIRATKTPPARILLTLGGHQSGKKR